MNEKTADVEIPEEDKIAISFAIVLYKLLVEGKIKVLKTDEKNQWSNSAKAGYSNLVPHFIKRST